MVISAEIAEADLRLLEDAFKDLPRQLDFIVEDAGRLIEGPMRREIMTRLNKKPTGRMARSVRTQTFGSGTALVGPTVPYAGIQNFGGIITAGSKLLAVPLSFGRVPKGKWPRDWPEGQLKLIPRKGKDSILATVSGKKKKLEPKYVLKERVKIKGVGYLEATEKAMTKEIEDFFAERIEALLLEAADRSGGST